MNRKFLVVGLICMMVAFVLAGCGGGNSGGGNASKQNNSNTKNVSANPNNDSSKQEDIFTGKTLVVSAQSWIIDKWPLQEAAEKFMQDHPGVKVEVKPAPDKGEADAYILQWSQGTTNVDLALGGSPADISPYVAKDFLVEFDDAFFSKIGKDKFVQPLLQQGVFKGKQYSVPLLGEVISLNVNVDHMKEAGLVDANGQPLAPKDWNELYDFAQKLTKVENGKTVRYGLAVDWMTNFITLNYYSGLVGTNNGKFLLDDGKTIDFQSDKAKELLEFWQRIVNDGLTPTDGVIDVNAGRNALKAGGVSMLWTASSRAQESEAVLGEGKVVNVPLPGTDQYGSIVFTHGMYIPKYSKNVELVKVFIQEQLLDKYGQQWSATKFGKLPVITEYYNDLSPGIQSMLKVMEHSHSEPLYQEQAKITDLMHKQISYMLTEGQSVEQTMDNLSKGFADLDVHIVE
jgi:ABC-type sugar transport system, periplasmic component